MGGDDRITLDEMYGQYKRKMQRCDNKADMLKVMTNFKKATTGTVFYWPEQDHNGFQEKLSVNQRLGAFSRAIDFELKRKRSSKSTDQDEARKQLDEVRKIIAELRSSVKIMKRIDKTLVPKYQNLLKRALAVKAEIRFLQKRMHWK